MTISLATVRRNVLMTGAAAAMALSAVLIPAAPAEAAPFCNPFDPGSSCERPEVDNLCNLFPQACPDNPEPEPEPEPEPPSICELRPQLCIGLPEIDPPFEVCEPPMCPVDDPGDEDGDGEGEDGDGEGEDGDGEGGDGDGDHEGGDGDHEGGDGHDDDQDDQGHGGGGSGDHSTDQPDTQPNGNGSGSTSPRVIRVTSSGPATTTETGNGSGDDVEGLLEALAAQQLASQASEDSEPGVPAIVWAVLGAALAAGAGFGFSKMRADKEQETA